jgi:hypothetical protein
MSAYQPTIVPLLQLSYELNKLLTDSFVDLNKNPIDRVEIAKWEDRMMLKIFNLPRHVSTTL